MDTKTNTNIFSYIWVTLTSTKYPVYISWCMSGIPLSGLFLWLDIKIQQIIPLFFITLEE